MPYNIRRSLQRCRMAARSSSHVADKPGAKRVPFIIPSSPSESFDDFLKRTACERSSYKYPTKRRARRSGPVWSITNKLSPNLETWIRSEKEAGRDPFSPGRSL